MISALSSNKRSRVRENGKKANIMPAHLLVQHEKFAQHLMLSAGVCFGSNNDCASLTRNLQLTLLMNLATLAHTAELAPDQMSRLNYQRPEASKFTEH